MVVWWPFFALQFHWCEARELCQLVVGVLESSAPGSCWTKLLHVGLSIFQGYWGLEAILIQSLSFQFWYICCSPISLFVLLKLLSWETDLQIWGTRSALGIICQSWLALYMLKVIFEHVGGYNLEARGPDLSSASLTVWVANTTVFAVFVNLPMLLKWLMLWWMQTNWNVLLKVGAWLFIFNHSPTQIVCFLLYLVILVPVMVVM